MIHAQDRLLPRLKGHVRLEIIVIFAIRHLNKRIRKVGQSGFLLGKPNFVETLSADATAQVSMQLQGQTTVVSQEL